MERVATEALRGFQHWYESNMGVDAHLTDQLALPCALIAAESRWTTPEITEHLRTVLWGGGAIPAHRDRHRSAGKRLRAGAGTRRFTRLKRTAI